MISQDDAAQAAQLITDCKTLLASDAYARVVQAELQRRFQFHLDAGRDLTKAPKRRAPHHQTSHVVEELLNLLESKLAAAEATLKQWHEQPKGEKYV